MKHRHLISKTPERDPWSIGNLALKRGYITQDDLSEAVRIQKERLPLGEILMEMGKLTKDQLDELLFEQKVLRGEISKGDQIKFERKKLKHQLEALTSNFKEVRSQAQEMGAHAVKFASLMSVLSLKSRF
jgi:ASC-1-like (ASCH) protein